MINGDTAILRVDCIGTTAIFTRALAEDIQRAVSDGNTAAGLRQTDAATHILRLHYPCGDRQAVAAAGAFNRQCGET